MGKSGHVARKIAATLASTGTPAFFVHPAEASHGDLGMITSDDVFVALSNSGQTEELTAIVPLVKRQGARLIALTGNPASALARFADIHLYAGAHREACPLNLAPTASTTAALALGDALAVALQLTLALEPQTNGQIAAQREIVAALENALDARRQRIIVSESTVNWVKWASVLLQALCALVAIGLVHSDNRATAAIAMGIFATGVAVSVVLIASHSGPFSGQISVGPDLLLQVRPPQTP
jgi:D-arabinose 5-phosphate isomerase GutQ